MRLIVLLACVLGLPAAAWADAPVSFELEIQPIFTSLGCNAGACHGKARGQNGFALSLLAFDPDFDFAALAKDARGRRVFPASPSNSLLLLKATAQLPHGGGEKMKPSDADYETLRRWITQGMPRRLENEPKLTRVSLAPKQQSMSPQQAQALTITAHYSDGSTRDVTRQTAFQSSDTAVASVDKAGLVKAGVVPGESVVMARFMHHIDTFTATVPLPGTVPDETYAKLPRNNFIDEHVWAKLKSLGIVPSESIDDAKFLRRAYLDILGRLPTAEETRAFLDDASDKAALNSPPSQGGAGGGLDAPKKGALSDTARPTLPQPLPKREGSSEHAFAASHTKRAGLIDALLDRPEYVDHWANKWADLLRPNPYRVGIKAVFNYDHWIRQSFRENWPYDRFVRELVTAQGSTWENGAAVLFRDRREPDEITTMVSQLFLGIRLECAKCHHHPFEKWSQEDYYSFAAYFAKLKHKGTGLSPPISGGEEIIFNGTTGEVKHPITGKVLPPRPLFEVGRLSKSSDSASAEAGPDGRLGKSSHNEASSDGRLGKSAHNEASSDGRLGKSSHDDADRREPRAELAAWITDPGNDFFAMVQVNRIWADLMGRPLVDPIDDLRTTNPPTNEPLLRALAAHFRQVKFDQRKLIRTIMLSHVYSLSSVPEPGGRNRADTRYHSRHYRTRMRAEVLLDAVSDITGIRESFSATPPGSRAMQTWTTRINSITLDTFGRPDENLDPPCERLPDSTVTQALHLMMSPELHAKVVSDGSLASKLAASKATPAEIAEALYLTVYSRRPSANETAFIVGLLAEKNANRRAVCEDVLWAMINSPEFLFKD